MRSRDKTKPANTNFMSKFILDVMKMVNFILHQFDMFLRSDQLLCSVCITTMIFIADICYLKQLMHGFTVMELYANFMKVNCIVDVRLHPWCNAVMTSI